MSDAPERLCKLKGKPAGCAEKVIVVKKSLGGLMEIGPRWECVRSRR